MTADIVEFKCAICGTPFHELEGGRCIVCGKIVCDLHFRIEKEGIICMACSDKRKPVSKESLNFVMKRPIIISLISLFYLIAAIVFFMDRGDVGYLVTSLFTAFCLLMAYGLWSLKKWARLAELITCYFQIVLILIFVVIIFLISPNIKQDWNMSEMVGLLLLFALIIIINLFIIKYLKKPNIREMFV